MKETSTEYAIEWPNNGYLIETLPMGFTLTTNPDFHGYNTIEDARDALRRVRAAYSRLGADGIGNDLVIVSRTTTVSRSEWSSPE